MDASAPSAGFGAGFLSLLASPFTLAQSALGEVGETIRHGQDTIGGAFLATQQTASGAVHDVTSTFGGAIEDVTETANPMNAFGLGGGLAVGGAAGIVGLGALAVGIGLVADEVFAGGAIRQSVMGIARRKR